MSAIDISGRGKAITSSPGISYDNFSGAILPTGQSMNITANDGLFGHNTWHVKFKINQESAGVKNIVMPLMILGNMSIGSLYNSTEGWPSWHNGTGDGNGIYLVAILEYDNDILIEAGLVSPSNHTATISCGYVPSTSQYVSVVFVENDSDMVKCYVNGTHSPLNGEINLTQWINTYGAGWLPGGYYSNLITLGQWKLFNISSTDYDTQNFNGSIATFELWNRTLNNSEAFSISQNYHGAQDIGLNNNTALALSDDEFVITTNISDYVSSSIYFFNTSDMYIHVVNNSGTYYCNLAPCTLPLDYPFIQDANKRIIIGKHTDKTKYTGIVDELYFFYYNLSMDEMESLYYLGNSSNAIYNLSLIDEATAAPLNLEEVEEAIIYNDDNTTYWNFKNAASPNVYLVYNGTPHLRLYLKYYTGIEVVNYYDMRLFDDADNVRLCANQNDTQYYQQTIQSITQRPVGVQNVFADCAVTRDYVRFSYNQAFVLKFYTTNTQYYLYTYNDDGTYNYLAGIDGGLYDTTYFIDSIEFNTRKYETNIQNFGINVERNESHATILWSNYKNDSVETNIYIERLNTSTVLFNVTETGIDANYISLVLDFTTMNITDTELFKVQITSTDKDGVTQIYYRYFNKNGQSGWIDTRIAFAVALLMSIFGLSLATSSITLGWFGAAIQLFSIILLSTAVMTWYGLFLLAINVILFIYCVIIGYVSNPNQTLI
jgi:hypothetical protein